MIVPLEGEVIDRVFHHRPIIAMFVESYPSDLTPGDKVFLYEKGGLRALSGEGSLVEISLEPVADVERYATELSLSPQELDQYVRSVGKSYRDKMLVLKVRDAIKYVRPLRCSMKIGEDGAYMTGSVFSEILAENY